MEKPISFIKFLFKAIANFNKHDGMVMAGHLAFLGMLALFPFIIFLVSLAGTFGQSAAGTEALDALFNNMPQDVVVVLRGPIETMVSTSGKGIMTFSIIGALWVSSSAIDAARLANVRAYSTVTRRPYIRRRAENLLLVILSASSIILGMTALVFGPVIWKTIISFIPIDTDWNLLWNLIRLSTSFGLIFGALCLAYFVLRPRKLTIAGPVAPGALAAIVLWMIVGNGFSMYLKYFGNYDVTYGSLAGAMIALVFFYFLSVGFILGAEINAALYHHRLEKLEKNEPSD
ncbi:YihY/virulence factor BrkB family protein [Pseudemcibacter aquimaris]|uniref:YihY/virulence factor BrkB family protein n=1 Tax=Pseudemcibacter aquimaris TaxID=2857064 RepID=UPI0020120672|nr:YihY/virulence factor BrkB family protein [Pseudemcibacter aquimaris]MCC3861309.1 YihY/virulence factor BrkB family protein [Pseudemcibacter aquimaris]WDU58082.1 YihY/virulence factor BrkB family protein [Pseudemcibacter aquimaris]